jgi:hypothetical protein
MAVLEERTSPKVKSVYEQLKDWAGLVSLVIALLYTFPIGVWDRFVTTEARRSAEELASLRSTMDHASKILAEGARAISSIPDPALRDIVGRAFNTRLFLLMSKNREALEAHKRDFKPPELIAIAYNFFLTNQPDVSLSFYEAAEQHPDADSLLRVEALRLRAKTLFSRRTAEGRQVARHLFAKGAALAQEGVDPFIDLCINNAMMQAWWGGLHNAPEGIGGGVGGAAAARNAAAASESLVARGGATDRMRGQFGYALARRAAPRGPGRAARAQRAGSSAEAQCAAA